MKLVKIWGRGEEWKMDDDPCQPLPKDVVGEIESTTTEVLEYFAKNSKVIETPAKWGWIKKVMTIDGALEFPMGHYNVHGREGCSAPESDDQMRSGNPILGTKNFLKSISEVIRSTENFTKIVDWFIIKNNITITRR